VIAQLPLNALQYAAMDFKEETKLVMTARTMRLDATLPAPDFLKSLTAHNSQLKSRLTAVLLNRILLQGLKYAQMKRLQTLLKAYNRAPNQL